MPLNVYNFSRCLTQMGESLTWYPLSQSVLIGISGRTCNPGPCRSLALGPDPDAIAAYYSCENWDYNVGPRFCTSCKGVLGTRTAIPSVIYQKILPDIYQRQA